MSKRAYQIYAAKTSSIAVSGSHAAGLDRTSNRHYTIATSVVVPLQDAAYCARAAERAVWRVSGVVARLLFVATRHTDDVWMTVSN
jgi:hypothetical protein